MNTTRDTLVETVRQNPLPAALAGIGIAWLLMNRSSSASRRTTERFDGGGYRGGGTDGYSGMPSYRGTSSRSGSQGFAGSVSDAVDQAQHAVRDSADRMAHFAGDAAHDAGAAMGSVRDAATGAASSLADATGRLAHQASDATGRLAHQASDATGQMIHGAAEAAGHFAHGAQHMASDFADASRGQVRRFEESVRTTLDTNPLAIGAAALAVGAALGYALPRTHREDELMGAARSRVLDTATHLAHDAAQSLQHVAGDARDAAKEALSTAAKADS